MDEQPPEDLTEDEEEEEDAPNQLRQRLIGQYQALQQRLIDREEEERALEIRRQRANEAYRQWLVEDQQRRNEITRVQQENPNFQAYRDANPKFDEVYRAYINDDNYIEYMNNDN